MDYYQKYLKYKHKYLTLRHSINLSCQSGGACMSWSQYCKKVEKRKEELENVRSTKSYIPKDKLTSRDKIYLIHDNGLRPFKVIANREGIKIYQPNDLFEDDLTFDKIVKKINNFDGYWYGFDSTFYEMHGNSVLIKIDKHKYIFVGWEIYSFRTDEEIRDYVSPVGNNDVPYPVAFGEKYIYFMLDKNMIKREDLETKIAVKNAEDLNGEYYGNIGPGTHKIYKMKGVKIIKGRLQ